MPNRIVTLTSAACLTVLVVTLAAILFPSPASAGPIELLDQLPEDASRESTIVTRPEEAKQQHKLTKRSYVDGSCKGVHDRRGWDKLYSMCKDCQNLYRDPVVGKECRRDCFASDTFVMCLKDLYMPVDVDKHLTLATSIRGS
uniref:CHH family peptide 3 n=1 Tax=Metopograpsus thukuhar TaxID=156081 RepID=A0A2I6QG57_9EUCA|nr:CHH family peptide 3 [Metopograpsus thukuhar]